MAETLKGSFPRTPDELNRPAREKEEENKEFRLFLKGLPVDSAHLDSLVRKFFGESRIDCTECGECCRALYVSLSEEDVSRLAPAAEMDEEDFKEKFLTFTDEEKPWIFRERACPFQTGHRCTIYDQRPADCRSYPHLDKAGFTDRLYAVIQSASICPIVFEVLERLKVELGFIPSKRVPSEERIREEA